MRFTSFLCTVSVLFLSGCAYLIPDNPSAPRYSAVLGERHMPELNRNVGQGAEQSAPVMPIASMDMPPQNSSFPPVSASTQAAANQQLAMNTTTLNPMPTGEMRQVPVENMAEASGVPSFNTVPARPAMSGIGSDAEQLEKVRAQLERDRTNATTARDQLSRDAAAEPSLLAPTAGTVPPPAPVIERPLAPPPAQPMPPALQPQSYVAPTPLMPPPPAPVLGAMTPAPMQPAPVIQPAPIMQPPSAMPGLEPIMLRPPVVASMPSASQAPARRPAPSEVAPSLLPRANGSFNPMASADGAYLPQSRYAR